MKTENSNNPEAQTCRSLYIPLQGRFVGVDEKRDVALFKAPPSNKSFFQRVGDVVFGEKS